MIQHIKNLVSYRFILTRDMKGEKRLWKLVLWLVGIVFMFNLSLLIAVPVGSSNLNIVQNLYWKRDTQRGLLFIYAIYYHFKISETNEYLNFDICYLDQGSVIAENRFFFFLHYSVVHLCFHCIIWKEKSPWQTFWSQHTCLTPQWCVIVIWLLDVRWIRYTLKIQGLLWLCSG